MQKLVWQNAKGDELNLTKDPFGITAWNGFSNAGLNIQSQQVPFADGSVFLDALMEQRELSVTLAINDENDLYTRYELKRQLISALNPKMGEGYLIYTNDFISKRIKCVAQIPIFPTKNSNDAGTQKASLSWVACEPYWEDLEETIINIKNGIRTPVYNNGDIPTEVEIKLLTTDSVNPTVKNVTNNKKITLTGTNNDNYLIKTFLGKKTVQRYKYTSSYLNFAVKLNSVTYSQKLKVLLIVGNEGAVYRSIEEGGWSISTIGGGINLNCVTYSEDKELFIAVGASGTILTSPDGINWTSRTSGVSGILKCVIWSNKLNSFIVVGASGTILTSPDGINWTSQTSGVNFSLNSVASNEKGTLIIVGASNTILYAVNSLTTWNSYTTSAQYNLNTITFAKNLNMFCAMGEDGDCLLGSYPTQWDYQMLDYGINSLIYNEQTQSFIGCGFSGALITSFDGRNWKRKVTGISMTFYSVGYSENAYKFLVVGNYGIMLESSDLENWQKITDGKQLNFSSLIYVSEKKAYYGIAFKSIAKSSDGLKWETHLITNNYACIDLAYSPKLSLFVAVGNFKGIYTSPDGINWTSRTSGVSGSPNFNKVIWSVEKELFVIVGESGTILTSPDGINWTSRTSGISYSFKSIVYSTESNCFVCISGNRSGRSMNGINWEFSDEITGLYTLTDLTYSSMLKSFIAVGQNGRIVQSFDGLIWNNLRNGTSDMYNLRAIVYAKNQNLLIAVGQNNFVTISKNGEVWEDLGEVANFQLYGCAWNSDLDETLFVGYYTATGKIELDNFENQISKISDDSNLNFHLAKGQNELTVYADSGYVFAELKFRQKYIGV